MATYKVIQDIEAEDKLLGPLTLKQFIYAIIVVVCGFIAFKLGTVAWYFALPFLPPMLLFGVLAAPLGRDQPTEIWVLAKLRYWLKPRLRTWDQTGQLNLVTITVPKVIDPSIYTDNLSQTEVKSRLKALSETIDTRGWAVKNVSSDAYSAAPATVVSSDRLLEVTAASQSPSVALKPDDDILDEQNNPVAQQLGEMISASTKTHRQATIKKMQTIRERMASVGQARAESSEPEASYWFMNNPGEAKQPSGYATFTSQSFSASTPGSSTQNSSSPSATDQAVLSQAKQQKSKKDSAYAHLRKLKPSSKSQPPATVTPAPDPAILELAHNDDLNVATIARQVDGSKQSPDNEVTVSLH